MKKIFAILTAAILFQPFTVQAATLYLDPASSSFGAGDTFKASIKIDTDKDACINAADVSVVFPKDKLELEDFGTGDSVISIWISKPDLSQMAEINRNGIISFSGGVPGGYCGKVPGDPGESNILGALYFKVKGAQPGSEPKAQVNFQNDSKILLNDGFGTLAPLTLVGATYALATGTAGLNELSDAIKADQTPPDPFVVELNKDDAVFGGKFFIIFTTTDKQTGVDHYEVMETKLSDVAKENQGKSWLDIFFKRKSASTWQRAESPYLLKDQTLQSLIRVKAVDKAGNEQLVEFTPSEKNFAIAVKKGVNYLYVYGIIGIILLALIFLFLMNRRKNRV